MQTRLHDALNRPLRLSLLTLALLAAAACGSDGGSGGGSSGGTTGGTTGGATTGGTTGGETTGGTTGGDTTGGTTGGETTGGATGGETTGGQTTAPAPPAPWTADCAADAPEMHTIDVGDVSLNVACQGSGPTMILLHGFPEFWYGWAPLMSELASTHRLIVPDQRGYNLSDKPEGLEAYKIELLVADAVGLIAAVSADPVVVVGHDWGGIVAWALAAQHPELLSHLVIANSPHPDVFARELAENPAQQDASFYISLFMSEGVEVTLAANDFELLASTVFTDAFSEEDRVKYKEAWGQPGALTAMLNWYRANFEDGAPSSAGVKVDKVPTLVMWGMADTALLAGNLDGLDEWVTDLQIVPFPDATHWINHEAPAKLAETIRAWLGGETVGGPKPPEVEPPVEPPPGEPALPEGMHGKAAPALLPLAPLDGVVDSEKTAVTPEDFLGHWTVVWFYPAANTFG